MLANKRKHSPVVFQTLLRIRKHFLKKCRKNSRECGHFENLLGCKYIQDKKNVCKKVCTQKKPNKEHFPIKKWEYHQIFNEKQNHRKYILTVVYTPKLGTSKSEKKVYTYTKRYSQWQSLGVWQPASGPLTKTYTRTHNHSNSASTTKSAGNVRTRGGGDGNSAGIF